MVGLTGCTVVLFDEPAIAAVDVRGSAPGTRETDALAPGHLVERVDALLLAGGSAYGLAAASGVVRWLEEHDRGFPARHGRVPIVPGAVLYDLGIGDSRARPGPENAYAACEGARHEVVEEGCIGAGTGATAGKLLGHEHAMKSGLGIEEGEVLPGIHLLALAVVNPWGDVCDPESGQCLAGTRDPSTGRPGYGLDMLITRGDREGAGLESTTLVAVVTDLALDRTRTWKLAQMAHDGLARTIEPVHTMYDGDAVFSFATGHSPVPTSEVHLSVLGALAARLVAAAILRGVRAARPMGGLPAARDLTATTR